MTHNIESLARRRVSDKWTPRRGGAGPFVRSIDSGYKAPRLSWLKEKKSKGFPLALE